MTSCIFCRIVEGSLAADIVYRDDLVVAFRDIAPQAPVHTLIIPCTHVTSVAELGQEHDETLCRCFHVARRLAEEAGLVERGFRLVTNVGPEAGQSVHHLHFHLLGGRAMTWPPG